jgi:alpha-mannosidase
MSDSKQKWISRVALVLLLPGLGGGGSNAAEPAEWTIYVTNDNCPDYTWGYTEEQTRQAFADIVRGHLDEMNQTDREESGIRDRYNMAVTQEAMCFVEKYPQREAELVRRIKEGRVFVSPFLCNSLWALHSTEGALRVLYPARRLEARWGIPIDVAEHIEEPSLPWGMATILAGAGVRWLSVPFYNYDSTFSRLTNPPLFVLEGPDGSRLRVILDPWASNKAGYTQGASILRKPASIMEEWLPHYGGLGAAYPFRAILASGTHGDIAPTSGSQTHEFAQAIIRCNAGQGPHPTLVNATVPQFCKAVDEASLPTLRGCFGHSWDLWPVSLAKYVADMREAERVYLAAETLLSMAAGDRPDLRDATRKDREQAEWYWAMLSDHAWNGTDEHNKRLNADLRKKWSMEFANLAAKLQAQGWAAAGLMPDPQAITVFNSLSFARRGLVRIPVTQDVNTVMDDGRIIPCQMVREGDNRVLYFVSPKVLAFSFHKLQLRPESEEQAKASGSPSTDAELGNRFYRLTVDPKTGGISSLIHNASGRQLCMPGGRTLCQTLFFDGREHALQDVALGLSADGPVLTRLRITGHVEGIEVENTISLYAELDRVDFDVRIRKPVTTQEQRLCQVFPVLRDGGELRIETPGAVIRPRPQPQGDLLPGADTRRFAVQGFVDASLPGDVGVTIAPLDAFALRLDLDPLTFEALGNDQNHREVIQDQGGVTEFRFRYALRAHAGGYGNSQALAWSRDVMTPLVSVTGTIPDERMTRPGIRLDPSRATATCLKPADGDSSRGFILRLWETAGKPGTVRIDLNGYSRAVQTDLLERDQEELAISEGHLDAQVNPYGFCSVRLLP